MFASTFKVRAADWHAVRPIVIENLSRRLTPAGLFTDVPRGGAFRNVEVSFSEAINLGAIGPVADQPADAPQIIRRLRAMTTRGAKPVFGSLSFGDTLDAMVAGQVGGPLYSAKAEPRPLPNEVEICTKPFFAKLTWKDANGLAAHVDVYFPNNDEKQEAFSSLFVKTTRIDSELFVAIARAVNTKEKTATAATRDGFHVSSRRTATKQPIADKMHIIDQRLNVQLARNGGLTIPTQIIERTSDSNVHYRVE